MRVDVRATGMARGARAAYGATMRDLVASIDGIRRDERGATVVEYGVLVAMIAAALTLSAFSVGDGIAGTFAHIASHF